MSSQNKIYYVYFYVDPFEISDPTTNGVFYVGKGKNGRCFEDLKPNSKCNKYKRDRIDLIRLKGGEPIVNKRHIQLSSENALKIEEAHINKFGRIVNNSGFLTNVLPGDLHNYCINPMEIPEIANISAIKLKEYYLSEKGIEHIKRRTIKNKEDFACGKQIHPMKGKLGKDNPNTGRKVTEEFRKQCSERAKGRLLSDDTKAKISKLHKGKKRSSAVGLKISASKIGKPRPQSVIDALIKSTQNCIYVNNGVICKRVSFGSPIPEGFVKGRIMKISHSY